MAKQDVLDAINATIVENGQKGISAQSLNNILTMIVENAGEGGSGDGALRVIVPDLLYIGGMIVEVIVEAGELSPSSWPEIKSFIESESGLDLSEYDAVVNASFAHNANVAQQILEKAKTGKGVSVVLDQTPYTKAFFNILLQEDPEVASIIESYVSSMVQPAALMMTYVKYTPEGESINGIGGELECYLIPTQHEYHGERVVPVYPSTIAIALNLDGSLIFEIDDTDTNTESGS